MGIIQSINTNAPHVLWLFVSLGIAMFAALVARRIIPISWSKAWFTLYQPARARNSIPVPWDPESVRASEIQSVAVDDETTQRRVYSLPPIPRLPAPPRLPKEIRYASYQDYCDDKPVSDAEEWTGMGSGVRDKYATIETDCEKAS